MALDTDHDGYVTIEDFLKFFANEPDIDYGDLKKLMMAKDQKRLGKLNFTDFQKWLGNAFSTSPGFYFRQNSVLLPEF